MVSCVERGPRRRGIRSKLSTMGVRTVKDRQHLVMNKDAGTCERWLYWRSELLRKVAHVVPVDAGAWLRREVQETVELWTHV